MFWCNSPDVCHAGKHAVLQAFWGHPPYRQQPPAAFTVVVSLVYVSGHTKICKGKSLGLVKLNYM